MNTKTLHLPFESKSRDRQCSRWLCVLAAMLLGITSPALAQTKDVITFTGGHADPNNPDIYVIDAEPDDVVTDPDGGPDKVRIQLSRPQGATATYEASITLSNLNQPWDEGTVVTFAPGETTKTVEIETYQYAFEPYNGNAPSVFCVLSTNHADAAYDVVIYNISHTATEEAPVCDFGTPLEVLQSLDIAEREFYAFRWGKYLLLAFQFGDETYVKIGAGSRLVLQTRVTDHSGLPSDADDYGMSKTRNVVLTPINVGAVSNVALYLYRPSDDEYMYSFRTDYNGLNIDNSIVSEDQDRRSVIMGISELGPFEVANPAQEAMTSIFFSQEDMQNTTFHLHYPLSSFVPEFSNISLDKTSYKSGETMTITATMDNWRVVKRALMRNFMNSFGVTLDGGQTTEPRRYEFDEQTGTVTYYATAPTVTSDTNVQVDFGPIMAIPVLDEEGFLDHYAHGVTTDGKSFFSVTVSPAQATAVPATAIDFVDMPADDSNIHLDKVIYFQTEEILSQQYPLGITSIPAEATDASNVTYTVTNSGTCAEIKTNDDGSQYLETGNCTGELTVTATLPSGVSTSRLYRLLLVPGKVAHTSNTYIVGTSFPKFQFQIEGWDEWTADEKDHPEGAVTVNYTHANGTTWTEHYKLSQLKKQRHETISSAMLYDLPFVFSEDHPDVDEEQIGKPILTAQVLINMDFHGAKATAEATASLTPDLKQITWDDFSYKDIYYNNVRPATVTAEVGNLPRRGFTVGYSMPELGIEETYCNMNGEPLPDWLTLEEDGEFYYTAYINPTLDTSGRDLDRWVCYAFYTLAQRTCIYDEWMEQPEWMQQHLSSRCNFIKMVDAAFTYKVNGEEVTGDLTFNNTQNVQTILNTIQEEGYYQDTYETIEDYFFPLSKYNDVTFEGVLNPRGEVTLPVDPLNLPKASYYVGDTFFGGANITLSCDGEVIQTLTGYKGDFSFQAPCDGRTYHLEVNFPDYDRTFNTTFVSADITNLYHINTNIGGFWGVKRPASLKHFIDGEPVILNFIQRFPYADRIGWETYSRHYLNGIVYMQNPSKCYIDLDYYGTYRLSLEPYLYKLRPDVKPELTLYAESKARNEDYWASIIWGNGYFGDPYRNLRKHEWSGNGEWSFPFNYLSYINYEELCQNDIQVTVIDGQGNPINNATINYATVDVSMASQGPKGSVTFDSNLGFYPVQTDATQFAQLIEAVADGYEPTLTTMYLWNYDSNNSWNKGKPRRQTIVLQQDENQLKSLTLETPRRDGKYKDSENMDASLSADNLLMRNEDETISYSQTAERPTVTKHIYDSQFGPEGWHGTKYIHITGMMPYTSTPDLTLTTANGSIQLQPEMKNITTADFPFSQNYCLFDFDLTDRIEDDAKFTLKNGTQTLASLPTLHNYDLDLAARDEASRVSLNFDSPDLTEVDDDATTNGVDMKDSGKAFDKFNFQLPLVLPFTVNIERDGDYFIIRACVEKNFLPGGQIMTALDKIGNYQYFDDQFQACMDAVNSGKPADDDFFDDIPRFPSAFVGIKGYLTGIGYYDRENNKFQFNFYDGGLIFEASAAASANVSFGIGSFGMSVDAKMAMTMGLVNTAAEMGDVSFKSTTIDFFFDYQARLKVCAWAYAGIDLWIAKAVAGVRGGACIDLHSRSYVTKGQSGMKTTLQAKMEAFAEARFLFWSAKKTWPIFNVYKEYLVPNNPSNPFHPSNPEPIFSLSRQNVTKSYKKLRRKVIADLGTPIISNVNGMARPDYLFGGESLLFNNLKTASNYNDDRLQLYNNGSKDDLVSTGINAPMYDFSEAHNDNGMEVVAFEQIKETIDGSALDAMSENDQTKNVTEKSEIHVAMRQNGGAWTTQPVGTYWGNIGCVTPAVAVQNDGKAAVIWQQGIAKFNNEGSRYIDGSLMLSRYDGSSWGEPIEIKRLHRRSVPADYQLSMKNDSILVMMTLQQDVENEEKQATVVYVNISPENKVRERYTQVEGVNPQMVSVNGANLVGYIKTNESGRDVVLNTVNMKGEPTGKLSGSLGMNKRTVNDYRLVVEDEATDLEDVALLWSQSDQETSENEDGTTTVNIKNRVYASKLCSHDKMLYFSTPVEVATMPDDVSLASMDGYLSDRDMKVAYCVTNEQDGGAVLENSIVFDNDIDHRANFNAYEVKNDSLVPFTITVANNGFQPIGSVDVTMNGESTSHDVLIMPQEKSELTVYYPVDDNFDGTIDYDLSANFIAGNSNALKVRRNRAASKAPRRVVSQNGTQLNVRQVDMALKVLSKKSDDNKTTIVAEVNNASLLPLADGMTVKVGLYNSPVVDENATSYAEATVKASDLYDADAKQNKVKIVTLTLNRPEFNQVLYLHTTPMQGSERVKDVRPANNVLPVSVVGLADWYTGINHPSVQTEGTNSSDGTLDKQSSNLYDLLGRPVKSPARRGIYVRKGKKEVIK